MTPFLLDYLSDPETGEKLELESPEYDVQGRIVSGALKASSGKTFQIINGIPRFVDFILKKSVEAFGDQWNYFNFDAFKLHWLNHTVKNTFGSPEAFKDKVIIDAGGGSGAQTLWMLQSGARHVIMLDLSHSVDDVVQRNLANSGFTNYDVIQCSIDNPPILPGSFDGIVICHNVIQHTPSVERTAKALYNLLKPGGEFVFNCYRKRDGGGIKSLIFFIDSSLRSFLKTKSFSFRHDYCRVMGILRFLPLLGYLLERSNFCVRGDVPREDEGMLAYSRKAYRATVLNTFDYFGAHDYQHYKTDAELKTLLNELQSDSSKILNYESYFLQDQPIGCALRVLK